MLAYAKALRYILMHNHKVRQKITHRVYPVGEVPQATARPFVTYRGIGETANSRHQQGIGDLVCNSVLIACWADDYSQAIDLQTVVRLALEGASGTYDGETLDGVFPDEEKHVVEQPVDDSEHQIQAVSTVYKVWHRT